MLVFVSQAHHWKITNCATVYIKSVTGSGVLGVSKFKGGAMAQGNKGEDLVRRTGVRGREEKGVEKDVVHSVGAPPHKVIGRSALIRKEKKNIFVSPVSLVSPRQPLFFSVGGCLCMNIRTSATIKVCL